MALTLPLDVILESRNHLHIIYLKICISPDSIHFIPLTHEAQTLFIRFSQWARNNITLVELTWQQTSNAKTVIRIISLSYRRAFRGDLILESRRGSAMLATSVGGLWRRGQQSIVHRRAPTTATDGRGPLGGGARASRRGTTARRPAVDRAARARVAVRIRRRSNVVVRRAILPPRRSIIPFLGTIRFARLPISSRLNGRGSPINNY